VMERGKRKGKEREGRGREVLGEKCPVLKWQ